MLLLLLLVLLLPSSPLLLLSCLVGDTRPCAALASAGAGATLLIHEATFEESLRRHALAKRHSTLPEAMYVAERMGAYR